MNRVKYIDHGNGQVEVVIWPSNDLGKYLIINCLTYNWQLIDLSELEQYTLVCKERGAQFSDNQPFVAVEGDYHA